MNIFNYLLISLFTILFCYIIFYWIYKSCFGSKIIEGIDGGNSKNTKSKDTKKDEGKEGEGDEEEGEDEEGEDEDEGDDSETQDEKNKNGTKVVTKSSVKKKDKKKRKGPSSKEIEKQSNEANAKLLDFNKDRQEANQPTPSSDKLLQAKFS